MFISDQHPVNNFRFLARAIGDPSLFDVYVPTPPMLVLARVIERVHALVAPVYVFEPFLTIAEVCKVGVTHYASPQRAQEVLGYRPRVTVDEAVQRVQTWAAPQIAPRWRRLLWPAGVAVAVLAAAVTAGWPRGALLLRR